MNGSWIVGACNLTLSVIVTRYNIGLFLLLIVKSVKISRDRETVQLTLELLIYLSLLPFRGPAPR